MDESRDGEMNESEWRAWLAETEATRRALGGGHVFQGEPPGPGKARVWDMMTRSEKGMFVRHCHARGMSREQIAAHYCVSIQTVGNYLGKEPAGVIRRRREKRDAQICADAEAGLAYAAIAHKHGVSRALVPIVVGRSRRRQEKRARRLPPMPKSDRARDALLPLVARGNHGRPIDMGGARGVWIDYEPHLDARGEWIEDAPQRDVLHL